MECIRGECVASPDRQSNDDWRNVPESLEVGIAASLDEVRGYLRLFREYVEDLEGQLGRKVSAGFAYCPCSGNRGGLVYSRAVGVSSIKKLSERTLAEAKRKCGGCASAPVLDLMR